MTRGVLDRDRFGAARLSHESEFCERPKVKEGRLQWHEYL